MLHYFVFNSFWTPVTLQYIRVWLHRQFITIIITSLGAFFFRINDPKKNKNSKCSDWPQKQIIIIRQLRQNCPFSPPIEIREAFKVFDRDGNGFISKQELGMAMRSLGYMPNEVELEVIIQRLDIDGTLFCLEPPRRVHVAPSRCFRSSAGDGQVGFEEFVTLLGPKLSCAGMPDKFNGADFDSVFWKVPAAHRVHVPARCSSSILCHLLSATCRNWRWMSWRGCCTTLSATTWPWKTSRTSSWRRRTTWTAPSVTWTSTVSEGSSRFSLFHGQNSNTWLWIFPQRVQHNRKNTPVCAKAWFVPSPSRSSSASCSSLQIKCSAEEWSRMEGEHRGIEHHPEYLMGSLVLLHTMTLLQLPRMEICHHTVVNTNEEQKRDI